MGLEESAPPSPAATTPRPFPTKPPPPPPETAAEKRRKLLGALEKCDEDLKTLRRIIAAVRAAEMQAAAASDVPTPEATDKGSYDQWKDGRDADPSPSPSPSPQKPRSEEHYPSPDSVLDAITSPRFPCRKRSSPCTDLDADRKLSSGIATVGSKIVKPSRTLVFSGTFTMVILLTYTFRKVLHQVSIYQSTAISDKSTYLCGDYCKIRPCNELHAVAMYHHPVVAIEAIPRWMPPLLPSSEIISWRHRRRWGLEAAASGRSRAMAESVGEVWGQGADEERHEAGRVGAALERAILHDLVGDVVAELLTQPPPHPSSSGHGAGAAMCRKRLVF
uniref:DUF3741 domain-containing protein n=1 Tax=Oryza brachyantha TaxID=4533 RepID=J3LN92_ORYBR